MEDYPQSPDLFDEGFDLDTFFNDFGREPPRSPSPEEVVSSHMTQQQFQEPAAPNQDKLVEHQSAPHHDELLSSGSRKRMGGLHVGQAHGRRRKSEATCASHQPSASFRNLITRISVIALGENQRVVQPIKCEIKGQEEKFYFFRILDMEKLIKFFGLVWHKGLPEKSKERIIQQSEIMQRHFKALLKFVNDDGTGLFQHKDDSLKKALKGFKDTMHRNGIVFCVDNNLTRPESQRRWVDENELWKMPLENLVPSGVLPKLPKIKEFLRFAFKEQFPDLEPLQLGFLDRFIQHSEHALIHSINNSSVQSLPMFMEQTRGVVFSAGTPEQGSVPEGNVGMGLEQQQEVSQGIFSTAAAESSSSSHPPVSKDSHEEQEWGSHGNSHSMLETNFDEDFFDVS